LYSSTKTVGATILAGLWALERAWHIAESNLRCLRSSRICVSAEPSSYSFRDISVHPDRRTWLDRSASDPDQQYIYLMGSETLSLYE